jgi:Putative S-adenosyl-L-methionine-dependent methyltransferase
MAKLLASISWIILAHATNEESEMGIRVYQRPASNDIYELRTSKNPPFCKEDENQDIAWYNFHLSLLFLQEIITVILSFTSCM